MNDRGFNELIGETIERVDTTYINVVHIHCASGKIVSLDAEHQHFGIPVVAVSNHYKGMELSQ